MGPERDPGIASQWPTKSLNMKSSLLAIRFGEGTLHIRADCQAIEIIRSSLFREVMYRSSLYQASLRCAGPNLEHYIED
jgi:hypothetical protein